MAGIVWCTIACLVGLGAASARALPAFARQQRLPCRSCHTVIPQLNPVGEEFRGAGYRLPADLRVSPVEDRELEYHSELTTDLELAERFFGRSPWSLKLTGDLRHQSRSEPETRRFWDELLLNAGGRHRRWSFYLHQHLHKGGSRGSEQYAAWIQASDLLRAGGHSASLQAGLFELELGLSPHITRLSSLGYLPYTATIGPAANFNLGEPELGLQLRGRVDPDWSYALAVVTGSGLHRENNGAKDLFVRLARQAGDGPAAAVFAYAGSRELRRHGRSHQNEVLRLGADARWRPRGISDLHLFGILVWGSDDRIFAAGRFRDATSLSGSIGADYALTRTLMAQGRLEWLRTNMPDDRQDLCRAVAGLYWLVQSNFRLTVEGAWVSRARQPDELLLFLGGLWAL